MYLRIRCLDFCLLHRLVRRLVRRVWTLRICAGRILGVLQQVVFLGVRRLLRFVLRRLNVRLGAGRRMLGVVAGKCWAVATATACLALSGAALVRCFGFRRVRGTGLDVGLFVGVTVVIGLAGIGLTCAIRPAAGVRAT